MEYHPKTPSKQSLPYVRKQAVDHWCGCIVLHWENLSRAYRYSKWSENKMKTFTSWSVFSPSGFQQRKTQTTLDVVIYLPVDTQTNAQLVVAHLSPRLFIGVKIWILVELPWVIDPSKVPVVYLSVKMRENQYLLKPWSQEFRKCLAQFSMILHKMKLPHNLRQAGLTNTTVAGITRVSSVLERLKKVRSFQHLEYLQSKDRITVVYGSVYVSDLPFIQHLMELKRLVPYSCAT